MILSVPLILIVLIAYKLRIIFLPNLIPKLTPKFLPTLLSQTAFLPIFQVIQKAVQGTVPSF